MHIVIIALISILMMVLAYYMIPILLEIICVGIVIIIVAILSPFLLPKFVITHWKKSKFMTILIVLLYLLLVAMIALIVWAKRNNW